ncbi:MAG: LysM peptidoglycan-binding domain-containing protein [Waltera sp.]
MMVAPTDNNNSDAYIIKLGDTLWAIARRYGCTVADIVKMNSNLITMPDRIRVGWQLNMPVK